MNSDATPDKSRRTNQAPVFAIAFPMAGLGVLLLLNIYLLARAPHGDGVVAGGASKRLLTARFRDDVTHPRHIRRLARGDAKLPITKKPDECVQGFNGDGIGTSIGVHKKPFKPEVRPFPCARFSQSTCCSNVQANEVLLGYDHFFGVGGTTHGVPRDTNSCLVYALQYYLELNEYFCLACNPDALAFMGCCPSAMFQKGPTDEDAVKKCEECITECTETGASEEACVGPDGDCAGIGGKDNKCGWDGQSCGKRENGFFPLVEKYKKGSSCDSMAVNTIRVCQSFADAAYNKPKAPPDWVEAETAGKLYDSCGVAVWIGEEPTTSNPNGIKPFFDVDGASGDDPVIPSEAWQDFEQFARDVKPPLFGEFLVVVVPDAEGDCFAGADNRSKDDQHNF